MSASSAFLYILTLHLRRPSPKHELVLVRRTIVGACNGYVCFRSNLVWGGFTGIDYRSFGGAEVRHPISRVSCTVSHPSSLPASNCCSQIIFWLHGGGGHTYGYGGEGAR